MIQYVVLIGAAAQLLGGSVYLRDTLRGRTKPNRVSFVLWAAAPFIGTAAAVAEGVTWAVLPVFMAGFVPFVILLASFANKNAYWKLGAFDYTCGAFSVLALILWAITQQPIVAIAFAIISDALASLPTLKKAWHYPETETGISYLAAGFSASLALLAIETWRFAEYAFPVYLILIVGALSFAIYRKDRLDVSFSLKK